MGFLLILFSVLCDSELVFVVLSRLVHANILFTPGESLLFRGCQVQMLMIRCITMIACLLLNFSVLEQYKTFSY